MKIMPILKPLCLIACLIGFAVPLSSSAHACKPGPGADIRKSPRTLYKTMPHIFLGRITAISKKRGQKTYNIRVMKSYKGRQPTHLTFASWTHSCGFFAKRGTMAIFFLRSLKKPLSAITPVHRFSTKASANGFAAKHFR